MIICFTRGFPARSKHHVMKISCYLTGFASSYGSSRDKQSTHDGGGGGGRGGIPNKMKAHNSNKEEDIDVDCKEDVASILDDLLRDDVSCCHTMVTGFFGFCSFILFNSEAKSSRLVRHTV